MKIDLLKSLGHFRVDIQEVSHINDKDDDEHCYERKQFVAELNC